MQYWNEFVLYFQTALPDLLTEEGIILAAIVFVLFGIFTKDPAKLGMVPIFAAIAYIAAEIAFPVWVEGREWRFPTFDLSLIYRVLTLYILLIFPIAIVFVVKTLVEAKLKR